MLESLSILILKKASGESTGIIEKCKDMDEHQYFCNIQLRKDTRFLFGVKAIGHVELDCKKQLGSVNFMNLREPVAVRRNAVEERFGRDRTVPRGRMELTRYRSTEGHGEHIRNNNVNAQDGIISAVPADCSTERD